MIRLLNKHFLWVGLCTLLLTSCKEKEIVPTADFTYDLAQQDLKQFISVYPAQEAIKITNKSTSGVSYAWDFGNGTTSTEQEPAFSYKQGGSYTITLTATSETGATSVSTKAITVVDRVLKKITVRQLNWNSFGNLPGWAGNKRADLILELGQRSSTGSPTQVSSVLYRAQPVKNVTNTTTSFVVPVGQTIVLNPANVNTNFLVNLYGNDGGGDQLIYSTGGSGIGYSAYLSPETRLYTITSGIAGTAVTLECTYE